MDQPNGFNPAYSSWAAGHPLTCSVILWVWWCPRLQGSGDGKIILHLEYVKHASLYVETLLPRELFAINFLSNFPFFYETSICGYNIIMSVFPASCLYVHFHWLRPMMTHNYVHGSVTVHLVHCMGTCLWTHSSVELQQPSYRSTSGYTVPSSLWNSFLVYINGIW